MTWFRVGGAGIPASLKNAMNAVFNKKFGTSGQNYPPKQWPDDVDLLGLLEEKTAAGVIANILDGADRVPTKNVIATIAPTLTGVSSVDVTRIGKNFLLNNIEDGSTGGITYTKRNDGSISCSGTVSNVNATRLINTVILPVGNYVLSGADNSINLRAVLYDGSGTVISNRNDTGSGVTISVDDTVSYIEIRIKARTNAEEVETIIYPMVEVGSTPTTYQRYLAPTVFSADLGRTIYGGTADLVTGEGVDENGNDFTFTGQRIETMLGVNNFWNDAGGDTSVTYRSSGTMTPITPTLITKTITENGSYQAADDQADGYSEVVVNVSTAVSADPIMSANAFVSKSGVSGTNISTVARSFTMSASGTLIFAPGTYGFTNTGSNDGYFEIQKNGVSVVKQYCNTSTNTPITVPEISVEENDVVDLVVGFDNAHSNCNYQFYSAMVVLSEV